MNRKKKNVESKTVGFLETHGFDLGKKDSLLKNIMLGGCNRFNPQTWRPRIVFLLSGSHDFMDFLGKTDVFGGLKKV